jgi:hypothetical protein
VRPCLGDLERVIHADVPPMPARIKAGLVHVQFETIHPFQDGNGRLGRLLVIFLLCAASVLREPILYLSLYLKTHRAAYYALLQRVRDEGDWEAWLRFFLDGVAEAAEGATKAARLHLSHPTIGSTMARLVDLGILRETTGRQLGGALAAPDDGLRRSRLRRRCCLARRRGRRRAGRAAAGPWRVLLQGRSPRERYRGPSAGTPPAVRPCPGGLAKTVRASTPAASGSTGRAASPAGPA